MPTNATLQRTPVVRPPAAPRAGHLSTVLLVVLTALAPMAWGTTYAVTTELLPPDHPLFASLMRSLPLGLLAVVITRTLPRGDWWWKVPVLGVLNIGAFFPLLFITAERLPGGVAATLGAAQPLVVAGLAVVVVGEKASAWRLAWGVAGVVGVALVVLGPGAGLDVLGIVTGLGGAVTMGVGVTLTKRWGRPAGVGPFTYAGWLLAGGGLFLLPLVALIEGAPPHIDGQGLAGYLWLGTVGGLIAYVLWFRGIGRLPVTAAALLALLSPLVAALLGVVLLGETFTPIQLTGFALALTALVAGQFNRSFPTLRRLRSGPHRSRPGR
ncbi:EamA family transporter [Myceligenerans indicum]|uniref:EamA family transporter n=1 Tax=Myceligenerans indicum TaxID=2593663 RepID=A0ABS1LK54_9MICO|nr:EamA family transporter [Myceligenerans indicum]MBL0886218.1 EamA family transporter [Myceligenerans indicum]